MHMAAPLSKWQYMSAKMSTKAKRECQARNNVLNKQLQMDHRSQAGMHNPSQTKQARPELVE